MKKAGAGRVISSICLAIGFLLYSAALILPEFRADYDRDHIKVKTVDGAAVLIAISFLFSGISCAIDGLKGKWVGAGFIMSLIALSSLLTLWSLHS
ncbi:hypothetical protein [Streptodolium elevatio]|uniref:Uncharacterized protein n=1 Tax=Streptodolium elevatio TaxID=3157996 RepID=A0ABV3DTY3_9ACTN